MRGADRDMLVYLASLPHSGSTLLSLLLAKHPHVVALGEVRLQIEKIRRDALGAGEGTCGCGTKIRDCPLWGRFIAERAGSAAAVEDLQLVVRIARDVHGPEVLLVDASKIREPLDELASARPFPVKVIHLSRDYRSWIVSAADLRRRKGKSARAGWLAGWEGALRWMRENRKLDRAIEAAGFPALRVGYEELVLAPPRVWPRVWEFLGLPEAGAPHDISGARNHMFSGNRMREDHARHAVSYDDRWFTRREWRSVSLLLPRLQAANRRWTYSQGVIGCGGADEIAKLATAAPAAGR